MTTPHRTPYPEPFLPPDPKAAAGSRIADFARWAARHRGAEGIQDPTDYQALHHWSVTDLEGFWAAVWEYFDVDATTPYERVLAIPHTKTGKKLEVPVKRLLQGAPAGQVLNPAAVDNPELIDFYARLGAERTKRATHLT